MSPYEGVLVYLLTAGIKDILELAHVRIGGIVTLIISGLLATLLVVGVSFALSRGLISSPINQIVGIVVIVISAAGVHRTVKVIGGLSRNDD